MKLELYSVKDTVAGVWIAPLAMRTRGEALRWFADMANNPKSQFGAHPADYDLFYVGYFDDNTGVIEMDAQMKLATASDLVQQEPQLFGGPEGQHAVMQGVLDSTANKKVVPIEGKDFDAE